MNANIKSLLVERRAKETLSLDKALTSVQDKITNVFGPLSQVWEFLEIQKDEAIANVSNLPDEERTEANLEVVRTAKDF